MPSAPNLRGCDPLLPPRTRAAALDGAPVIEQDVARPGRRVRADNLVRSGRDIERRVLTRDLFHLAGRVLRDGDKTVLSRP